MVVSLHLPSTFDKARSYYIAGPMSGYPEYNYAYFEAVQLQLSDLGVTVKSPHNNPWPEDSAIRNDSAELWRYMMKLALRLLLECDGIILLKGWTESRGALNEVNVAAGLKMPMYFLGFDRLIPMHKEEYND